MSQFKQRPSAAEGAQRLDGISGDENFTGDYADDAWPGRLPSSARRYQAPRRAGSESAPGYSLQGRASPIPARRSASLTTPTSSTARGQRQLPAAVWQAGPRQARKPRLHWLTFVGLAVFVMLAGWLVLTYLGAWWQTTQDDWHYGRPRTFQVDAVVGHGDSAANPSHFIALDLHGRIEIIEFPGGDISRAIIYPGPTLFGEDQDLVPVTLRFEDVNGDGKPDMVVIIRGSGAYVLINDNGRFRPVRQGEQVHL